jgi:hypothetical protein
MFPHLPQPDHITTEELAEALTLRDIGWAKCTREQKDRWLALAVKANKAAAHERIFEVIAERRAVIQAEALMK